MVSIDLAGILDVLASQELPLGFFLAGAGLVFMLFGFRVSRALVAISYGVVGFVLGSLVPGTDEVRVGLGFLGAICLGMVSTVHVRVSLMMLAGIWAAYLVLLGIRQFQLPPVAMIAAGVIAFIGAVSVAIIMRHEVTAFVLSLEGSVLFIAGLVIFMSQSPAAWAHMRNMLITNPIFAPFALLTGAVTGFYWQLAELRQRETGTIG